ncbi:hypothetical protein [Niveispirillum cyanobacteriorum]|uniref:Uncharacterized protein n=1 Tax=Niveispirillum cyanobacteriorum TaxID=1612173 RepID=A0A2K9NDL3_9PROT|nr:hypothetical protein [Niveispirillum cyanobacteriorum]AUN31240.1 hypothetical protein C0V82_14110 [Niveispirillum cyanobacteriorum]GGE73019.1 hypothetical protein GCM10011317_32810 [Niveispirillum cyanobacteriorum]
MKIGVQVDSDDLRRAYAAAPEVVREHLAAGVMEALFLLQRETVERTPRAQSLLANSIQAEPLEMRGTVITGRYGTALAYAQPVEDGSRAHWAPLPPLLAWVKAKGLQPRKEGQTQEDIARAIQFKIAAHGTKGAKMFERALTENTAQVEQILNAAAARGVEAVAGMA